MYTVINIVVVLWIIFCSGCAIFPERVMHTSQYFDGVEIQYENELQKKDIKQVLCDILNLSKDDLRKKRYPDYAGKEKSWSLSQIIYRYFVADNPRKKLGDNLCEEVKTHEVQVEIKKLLQNLTSSSCD